MENWKPIVGWETSYEVSDLGRVRRAAEGHATYVGRILTPIFNNYGYLTVTLCYEGCRQKVLISRLVAAAFIGPPPPGKYEVNHGDGDKKHNALANLEYVSGSGNKLHSYRSLGRKPAPQYGEANGGGGKLTSEKVDEIRRLYATGWYRQKDLGMMFEVSQPMIGNITRGTSWTPRT